MSNNVNNQYDFFKIVNLDDDGNIGVVLQGGGGTSSPQPFAFTADNYTDLLNLSGMTDGDLAYVVNSEGTAWLPGTIGGSYYPNGIYIYATGTWTSDRNAIALQLSIISETYEVYQVGSNNITNTPTAVDFNTERASSSFFTLLAGGVIRVDKVISKLVLDYSISLDITINSRTTASHQVYVNGLPYAGSLSYTYHRTLAAGEDTAAKSVILNGLVVNDTIEIRSTRISGGATPLITISEGSNVVLNIKED